MTDNLALKEKRQGTVSQWPSVAGNFNSEKNLMFIGPCIIAIAE
jgi:hypothetical protein